MPRNSEIVDMVTGELRRYGLKPSVEETNGNHYRVVWTVPGKGQRSLLAGGKGGSDHRARLNNRAAVRRMIREDGITDPIIENSQKPLVRKILEPARQGEPIHLQVAEMRAELEDITALLLDIAVRVGAPMAAAEPLVEAPVEAPAVNGHRAAFERPTAASKLRGGTWQAKVFAALPYDGTPIPITEIARIMERHPSLMSGPLFQLKKLGLAATPEHGWWRRADRPLPEGWQKPVKEKRPRPSNKKEKTVHDEKREAVLNAIPFDRPVTIHELVALSGKNRGVLGFYLTKLKKRGEVRRVGNTAHARWVRPKNGTVARIDDGPHRPPSLMEGSVADLVLKTIPAGRGVTARELAETIQRRPQPTWVALSSLKKKGLVKQTGGGLWARASS